MSDEETQTQNITIFSVKFVQSGALSHLPIFFRFDYATTHMSYLDENLCTITNPLSDLDADRSHYIIFWAWGPLHPSRSCDMETRNKWLAKRATTGWKGLACTGYHGVGGALLVSKTVRTRHYPAIRYMATIIGTF